MGLSPCMLVVTCLHTASQMLCVPFPIVNSTPTNTYACKHRFPGELINELLSDVWLLIVLIVHIVLIFLFLFNLYLYR